MSIKVSKFPTDVELENSFGNKKTYKPDRLTDQDKMLLIMSVSCYQRAAARRNDMDLVEALERLEKKLMKTVCTTTTDGGLTLRSTYC